MSRIESLAMTQDREQVILHQRKTMMCRNFIEGGCSYDEEDCDFAHGEADMRKKKCMFPIKQCRFRYCDRLHPEDAEYKADIAEAKAVLEARRHAKEMERFIIEVEDEADEDENVVVVILNRSEDEDDKKYKNAVEEYNNDMKESSEAFAAYAEETNEAAEHDISKKQELEMFAWFATYHPNMVPQVKDTEAEIETRAIAEEIERMEQEKELEIEEESVLDEIEEDEQHAIADRYLDEMDYEMNILPQLSPHLHELFHEENTEYKDQIDEPQHMGRMLTTEETQTMLDQFDEECDDEEVTCPPLSPEMFQCEPEYPMYSPMYAPMPFVPYQPSMYDMLTVLIQQNNLLISLLAGSA